MNDVRRVALITGASRGMGFEASRQLARRGYTVVLAGRDETACQQSALALRQAGLDANALKLDVSEPEDAPAAAERVRADFSRLDVLINNAGAFFEPTDQSAAQTTSIFTATPATLRRSLETNALGALYVAQAMIPLMRLHDYGRIVNVSSTMGSLSSMQRGWPAYRLSKAALNAITRLLAVELEGTNIKVNSVCPGWVRTAMGGPMAARSVEEGVDTTVWLATLPDDGPSGGFFQDRKPVMW